MCEPYTTLVALAECDLHAHVQTMCIVVYACTFLLLYSTAYVSGVPLYRNVHVHAGRTALVYFSVSLGDRNSDLGGSRSLLAAPSTHDPG